jgi:hypothetical protein
MTEDPGLVSVPEAMFEACQELEQRMGGAEATVAALAAPSDDPLRARLTSLVGGSERKSWVGARPENSL